MQELFAFMHPMLAECEVLINVYHNYQQVVELILFLYCECVRCMLCFLPRVCKALAPDDLVTTISQKSELNGLQHS